MPHACQTPVPWDTQRISRNLPKWEQWGGSIPIEELRRKDVREFLDWVHERAAADEGMNPGRTANKAREHLRVVLSWAWEQELIDTPPRFPKPREQCAVAGRHYLTRAEINALYFATHSMVRRHERSGCIDIQPPIDGNRIGGPFDACPVMF